MLATWLSQQTPPVPTLHQQCVKAHIERCYSAQHQDKNPDLCRAAQLRTMLGKHWLRLRLYEVRLQFKVQDLFKCSVGCCVGLGGFRMGSLPGLCALI